MVTPRRLSTRAVAAMHSGRPITAELRAPNEHVRRWAAVYPYISGVPGGAPYRGDGIPTLDIHVFEVPASSITAGYDVAGELMNELRVTVQANRSFDATVENLEEQLLKLNLDPAVFDEVDKEFPL